MKNMWFPCRLLLAPTVLPFYLYLLNSVKCHGGKPVNQSISTLHLSSACFFDHMYLIKTLTLEYQRPEQQLNLNKTAAEPSPANNQAQFSVTTCQYTWYKLYSLYIKEYLQITSSNHIFIIKRNVKMNNLHPDSHWWFTLICLKNHYSYCILCIIKTLLWFMALLMWHHTVYQTLSPILCTALEDMELIKMS